jgi:hypothetical protein
MVLSEKDYLCQRVVGEIANSLHLHTLIYKLVNLHYYVHKLLPSGFVEFLSLMKVPMLRYYKPDEALDHIHQSVSESGRHRFEKKTESCTVYVRALYGRHMEWVCNCYLKNKIN